jgi:hypothetical protein
MTLDFVTATYLKDLYWSAYSIQLLFKHFRGAFGVHLRADENCRESIETWGFPPSVKYHYVTPWPDTYAFHMYLKATADQYSKADLIALIDADHLLLEPMHIEDLLDHGKPIIRYREWDEDPNDSALVIGKQKWGQAVERALGIPLDREYMVGPPLLFWRDTFEAMRHRVEKIIGLSFKDAVYSDTPYSYKHFLSHPIKFCDYEALGAYASAFEPDRYSFQHLPQGFHWPFRVYWSHGDWNLSLQRKLDKLLEA